MWHERVSQDYRVRQANFLFHMALHIQKRKLACHTLYYSREFQSVVYFEKEANCSQAFINSDMSVFCEIEFDLEFVSLYKI
jgi:hypothetical protein